MASDINGNQWYQPLSGLGSVGAYQISGIPFATGSLSVDNVTVTEISFPLVTKFVVIRNNSANDLRVGFSENGINDSNYFILGNKESYSGDLRITKLYLRGDTTTTEVTVVAGLTGIGAGNLPNSWSGSIGVG